MDSTLIEHLLKGTIEPIIIENVKEDFLIISMFNYFLSNTDELNIKEWDVFLRVCWLYMNKIFDKSERPRYRKIILNGFTNSVDMAICARCKGYDLDGICFMRYAGLFLHLWHKVLNKHPNISEDEKNDYKMSCNKLARRTRQYPSEAIYIFCAFPAIDVFDEFSISLHPKKDVLVAIMKELVFNQDEVHIYEENPLNYTFGWFKEVADGNCDIDITEKMRSDVIECIEYLYEYGFEPEIPLQQMIDKIKTLGLVNDSEDESNDMLNYPIPRNIS